jgi:hypothetical protein
MDIYELTCSFFENIPIMSAWPQMRRLIDRNVANEMIQIHDDLNDALAVPASPDWTLGRFSLLILFASTVDHPDKDEFLQLRKNISDQEALVQAQEILIRCGAISYCIHVLLERYKTAGQLLESAPVPNKEGLHSLLKSAVQPVLDLYASLGLPDPLI